MATKVEFAVQISCDSCVTQIENSLKNVEGIKEFKISKENGGSVLVESSLPSSVVQEKIESTGRKAVLKGYGSQEGEKQEFSFTPIEVDSSGVCGLCKPTPSKEGEDKKNNAAADQNNDEADSGGTKKKRARGDSKSDDEVELELNYSSDSDDGNLAARIKAFNDSADDDIWKIEEDLEADFDVIDADEDKDETGNEEENEKKETDSSSPSKRKLDESKGTDSAEKSKPSGPKSQANVAGNKFLTGLKASKVRRGDCNWNNGNIGLTVIIMPENKANRLGEKEAQEIKDSILYQLFLKTQQVQANEPGAFLLKFSDCKLVRADRLFVTCDNKETFDWLLSWDIPVVGKTSFKAVPALDEAPLQKIKFSLKTKWIPNDETMLKLIHLQNRDINTNRWILDDKKPAGNGMEQFEYKIDFGSVRALDRLGWSFFYELFAIKVTEFNGKSTSNLQKGKSSIEVKTN